MPSLHEKAEKLRAVCDSAYLAAREEGGELGDVPGMSRESGMIAHTGR
jgi:hypothetical protein